MTNRLLFLAFFFFQTGILFSQGSAPWQQAVSYQMEIDMDVITNRYQGKQKLIYTNNSPDTLTHIFYHLYFNAFQPNSMMDVRSRNIPDPDSRVGSRIYQLKPDEIGYLKVKSLQQNGQSIAFEEVGTILEVRLEKPLLPKSITTFEMVFEGQVPLQIRRSGRDSKEGVRYSMSQWYPKLCEYDGEGWHANPYIGREFHGVWGDFDVKITIDSAYTLGGTGYLQNPQEIGKGYQKAGTKPKKNTKDKLSWHFVAPKVHDFMWAADPDFLHTTHQVPNGPTLHFLYKDDEKIKENWQLLPEYTIKSFEFMNQNFGKYPYKQFSVIQGGDGGMEYPMSTLITGHRTLPSLVNVTVHELIHSWFQGVLASNELRYAWIDEGFTTYATTLLSNQFFPKEDMILPHERSYQNYFNLVKSGLEEPMTTHADHFATNRAYGSAAYSKGAVMLSQLGYIIGQKNFMQGMKRYFDEWKFKHPNPTDFKRVMEKTSGIELDWFFEHWVGTTNTIDYGIGNISPQGEQTLLTLHRHGNMMMPLDVVVVTKAGNTTLFYIPLRMMRGEKPKEHTMERVLMPDWPWTYPTYNALLPIPIQDIKSIWIDPTFRLADIDRTNNFLLLEKPEVVFEKKQDSKN